MNVERTNLFCPNCGAKSVVVDRDDSGDYYEGTSHYCTACHRELPDLDKIKDVLWKQAEFGADEFTIRRYLEVRIGAGLPPETDAETVRIERELAEAHRMYVERMAKR
mgnify:FL=1